MIKGKLPLPNYKLHTNATIEVYNSKTELIGLSDKDVRDHFRQMIKEFNNTLRPYETARKFIKVEREFRVRYKTKTVRKFIKI